MWRITSSSPLLLCVALSACTEAASAPAPSTAAVPAPSAIRPELRERVERPEQDANWAEPIEVSFATSDGFTIHGTLFRGEASGPAIVLAHQLHSSRAEWTPLVERLQHEPALTVLAMDLRGHGASQEGPTGAVDTATFETTQWAALSADVLGAVAYLRTQPHGIRPARIGLVGSSIGSTAVILAAAADPTLDTLVTLSPGRAYRGVDAITPAIGLGQRHLLSIAASGEADSVEAGNAFVRITSGEELVLDGSEHGVALLAAHPSALERLDAFLRASLGTE